MGRRTSYPPGAFCWTDLSTSDSADATSFYTGLFGWEPEVLSDQGLGDYTLLRVGGALVAALHSGGASPHPAWLSYVSVADVGATAERVAEAGGRVLRPAFDLGSSGRMALVADPTNAVFALWQAAEHHGAELVNDAGALCMNQCNTSDPETAQRFYTEVFGWRVELTGTDEQAFGWCTSPSSRSPPPPPRSPSSAVGSWCRPRPSSPFASSWPRTPRALSSPSSRGELIPRFRRRTEGSTASWLCSGRRRSRRPPR